MNYATISGFDWLLHQDFPEAFPLQPTTIFDVPFFSADSQEIPETAVLFRIGAYDPLDEGGDVELIGYIYDDCVIDTTGAKYMRLDCYERMPKETRAFGYFRVDRTGRLLELQDVN